ncbi:DNA-binding protein [Paraburkholderia strydomiana]|uniref:DNA-binding protein n=1 Tax=Paraburkholderia strydomiana TaxID=1245417 RepID=A0ABW9BWP4_9BURK
MSLETDIQAARDRLPETQALYREVCALMFFRYGETPTANKLYQLVRKGSMSAPAKALRDFWTDVRDKSRVDVGQPDLPPEIAKAAGELAATFWRLANDSASQELDGFRNDARLEIEAAVQRATDATAGHDAAQAALRACEERTSLDKARIADLEARLAEQQTANAMLREQLLEARREANFAVMALTEARRDFSAELEKLRQSISQSEHRLMAAERRALLEIETERSTATRARKDLKAASDRFAELEAEYRVERDALRDSLASLKTQHEVSEQQRGDLEARLTAKDTALIELRGEADSLRRKLASFAEKAVSARTATTSRRPAPHPPQARVRKQHRAIKFSGDPFGKRTDTGN